MPSCPTLLFQPKGELLGGKAGVVYAKRPRNNEEFADWVFKFLQVRLSGQASRWRCFPAARPPRACLPSRACHRAHPLPARCARAGRGEGATWSIAGRPSHPGHPHDPKPSRNLTKPSRNPPTQVTLTIRNQYEAKVRVNWIHGSDVKEVLLLDAGASTTRQVFLSHTLHAERIDRKGQYISVNSSLLLHKVVNASDMVVPATSCLDRSGWECEDWMAKGECERNPGFMKDECPKSCGLCEARPSTRRKPTAGPKAATARAKGECGDDHIECVGWAVKGQCTSNRRYMESNCKRSCGKCGSCFDKAAECTTWADSGQCEANAAYMRSSCAFTCGYCDGVGDADGSKLCVDDFTDCQIWARGGDCLSNAGYMGVHCRRSCALCADGTCKDDQPAAKCAQWAKTGECEKNAGYMKKACARTCGLCVAAGAAAAVAAAGAGAGAGAAAGAAPCIDVHNDVAECNRWADAGHCVSNEKWMHANCRRSCRLCNACADLLEQCSEWKEQQQCSKNRRFMAKHCVKTCDWCGLPEDKAGTDGCYDEDAKCDGWAKAGECKSNAAFMHAECKLTCKKCAPSQQRQPTPPAKPTPSPPKPKPPPKPESAAPPKPAATTTAATRGTCVDNDSRCAAWAKAGQCSQAGFMMVTCAKACNAPSCAPDASEAGCDDDARCVRWAQSGECQKNVGFMEKTCRKSCNWCGSRGRQTAQSTAANPTVAQSAASQTAASRPAAQSTAPVDPVDPLRSQGCVDNDRRCPAWARAGQCDKASFMMNTCAKSCNAPSCQQAKDEL